jgi:putative hydrolase
VDVNAVVGFLLRDLAAIQASPEKKFGYKRAASAVLALDDPLTALMSSNGLVRKISGVGAASTRIIREVLDTGSSATVEEAIVTSGRSEDIARRRMLRPHFLSRAEVRRVLDDSSLTGGRLEDYRGDFQMHSVWSDGVATVTELAAACVARGYGYSAVTDHSYGLKIAGGMSMDEAGQQHEEIERINAAYGSSFRMIKGIEANIDVDGALDLSAEEADRFDIVLAAPHSKLRSTDDQTSRLLRAIATPQVRILAHPRGRKAGSRAGIVADWGRIFDEAAAAGVAIEIDGDPSRQDVDHVLAAQAVAAGCLFALDSDAHGPGQLLYAETALAHARLAGVSPDDIVNFWPLDRVMSWLDNRRPTRATAPDGPAGRSHVKQRRRSAALPRT